MFSLLLLAYNLPIYPTTKYVYEASTQGYLFYVEWTNLHIQNGVSLRLQGVVLKNPLKGQHPSLKLSKLATIALLHLAL